jgi:hypothetical protein
LQVYAKFPEKKIIFKREFMNRIIQRNIWSAFGFNLEKTKDNIEAVMRGNSVVVENPTKNIEAKSFAS